MLFRKQFTILPQLPLRRFSLQFYHTAVKSALLHQFRRGALLDHMAVLQHYDVVRTGYGTHSVGDYQHRLCALGQRLRP